MSLRNDNIRMMAGGEIESQPSKPIRLLRQYIFNNLFKGGVTNEA